MKQKKLLGIVAIAATVSCTMHHYLAVQNVIVMNTTRWQKFKRFMWFLGAVIAGASFFEKLAEIQQIKRNARRPKNLDKKMLTHHYDCMFWDTNHKKCDCYIQWIQEDLKELDRLREAARRT